MVDLSGKTILTDYSVRLAVAKEDEFLALHEEFVSWLANLEEFFLEEFEQQDDLAQYQEFFTACQRRYKCLPVQLCHQRVWVPDFDIKKSLLSWQKRIFMSAC